MRAGAGDDYGSNINLDAMALHSSSLVGRSASCHEHLSTYLIGTDRAANRRLTSKTPAELQWIMAFKSGMKHPAQFIEDRRTCPASGTVGISTSCAHDLPYPNSSAMGSSVVVAELPVPQTMPNI